MALVPSDGTEILLSRLDAVGPFGLPGDKAWSLRGLSGAHGAVSIPPSLNARFRLENSYQGKFAVGANSDLVGVRVAGSKVELTLFPFSARQGKPGELAVTRALATVQGLLTATVNGHTLILTSTKGVTLTLVSTQ